MPRPTDPSAIDGKLAPPEEHADVLVIGAGPAGTAAAIEAAKLGASVVLIDENPVDPGLMGLDTPLLYGGRMSGAVQRPRFESLMAANPALEEAAELGVDVRMGLTAWGLYVNGPALRALPAPMVGLADADRSWMCGFDRLILATGARDVALAFPGWDQPGVVGANGLHALLQRYDAFTGRRLVVLGSGDLGVETALMAQRRGLEVAAVVEVLDRSPASPERLEALLAAGIALLTGHTPQLAQSGRDGVERLRLAAGDPQPGPLVGSMVALTQALPEGERVVGFALILLFGAWHVMFEILSLGHRDISIIRRLYDTADSWLCDSADRIIMSVFMGFGGQSDENGREGCESTRRC